MNTFQKQLSILEIFTVWLLDIDTTLSWSGAGNAVEIWLENYEYLVSNFCNDEKKYYLWLSSSRGWM